MSKHAVAMVILLSAIGSASTPDDPLKIFDSTSAPGAAVLVLQDGRTVFERGYGVANLQTHQAITPRTNFRLASVTKQFTAMSIMLLVHDRKLTYDTRVTDIFPEFPPYGREIRIRHLLNHTAGLQDYEDLMEQFNGKGSSTSGPQIQDAGVLALLERTSGTKFPPGSQFSYSNSGYVLLGLIVEKTSGEPFGKFLHDRIFAPLSMSSTLAYQKGKNEVPQRAYGYSKNGDSWRDTDQSATSATLGDGGVYSNVVDLAKWLTALDDNQLLSATEMAPAYTPVPVQAGSATLDGKPVGYGFGWGVDTFEGSRRIWHSGETSGFRTNIQRFPDRRLAIVVLQNRTDIDPYEVTAQLSKRYLKTNAK